MAQAFTISLAAFAIFVTHSRPAWPASPDAGPAGEITLVPGQTTTVVIQTNALLPPERHPRFLAQVPSYRRAVDLDGQQQWFEAAATYQRALIEVGHAAGLDDAPWWEDAAFKIDLERRRSQTLARAAGRLAATRGAPPSNQHLDRGRLLRLKLMSIRAATGGVPTGLASATIAGLSAALPGPAPAKSTPAGNPPNDGDNPDVRLLLCATRAVLGDRAGARLELAHVRHATRTSAPLHALALATCQVALGDHDDALGSLAVGVYRLGPSSRFLPGQTRELQIADDWDPLRRDPRFERIFR